MAHRNEPEPTAEAILDHARAIVDHARRTARGGGRASLEEMIEAMEAMIDLRCATARVLIKERPDYAKINDWQKWGRTTFVFEHILSAIRARQGRA